MKTKILSLLLALVTLSCLAIPVSAESNSVTLRIEGISENFYYSTVEISESATVADVIISADANSDKITVVGAESFYITDINGEIAGTFGGWDGWSYMVNGEIPAVGIGDYTVKNGDTIVVYYSDSFGVGMQYPVMDTSKISEGILTFTSTDTTYDENYNPTTTVNPVADMTVLFDNTEYKTDKQGSVTVAKEQLTAGEHSIQVSKASENGVPLVLRFAPDAKVTIAEATPDGGGFNFALLLPLLAALVIIVILIGNLIKKKT